MDLICVELWRGGGGYCCDGRIKESNLMDLAVARVYGRMRLLALGD